MAAAVEFEWPVVARESELAEIEQCMAMRMGALLVGAPGVGKSSLLDAALERATRAGARVARAERLDGLTAEATRRTPARPWPIVIGVDDVHLADPAVFGPAHRLVHTGQALLLATTEPDAPLPDEVRRLLVGKRMRRLAVEALGRSGSVRMLTARLGGPVAVDTAERFWELSRGNPLILRELTDQGLAEDTLRPAEGIWHWPGLRGGAPCGRLADMVDLLLGDLDPGERELVNMLALAGTLEAGLPVVTELGDAAESLNRRGVLVARRSGLRLSLRLAHPLCEAVVAARLPELTARRLKLRIADAIERTGARRLNDAARTARLRLGTGQPPGPTDPRKAAADALRGHDYPLAELLCRAVPAAEADDGLVAMLGAALAGQRRHIEAEALLGSVAPCGAVARMRALNLAFGLGRLAEAEAAAGADRGVRALVRLLKDRIAEAKELAGSVTDAPTVLALLHHESGDSEAALAVLRQSRPALSGGDDATRLDHHFLSGWITLDAHGPAAAEVVSADLRECAADGGPRARMLADLLQARVLRATGRTAQAVDLLRGAAAHRGPADWLATRPWRIAQLAGAVAESGDLQEAASLLEQARAAQRDEWQHPLMADAVALEAALVTAYLGDRVGAARQALETAARALAAGRRTQGLAALHLAARAGEARGAVALWQVDPEGATADDVRLRHIQALADDDGRALDAVSQRCSALGLLPLAAEASARAGRAHEASGDRGAARAARAASAELIARCGAPLPAWALPAGAHKSRTGARSRTELTVREREIAMLAVSLSNQEIADRLVLSVRTVENHLYRAYGKLAVTTRAELAPRLGVGPSRLRRIA